MESYFNGKWSDSSLDVYPYSGWSLVEKINAMNPDRVLDVGCGFNRFKDKINNLKGIDPYNDAADVKIIGSAVVTFCVISMTDGKLSRNEVTVVDADSASAGMFSDKTDGTGLSLSLALVA